MKHTPTELAEIIARKCAVEICYKCGLNPEYQDNVETFMPATLSSTALVELLECVALLRKQSRYYVELNCDCSNCTVIKTIDTKLKSIIGEEI